MTGNSNGGVSRPRPAFPLKPNFATDLYAGTALYYAKYRAGYPESMLDDIIATAEATGDGMLLDLACGTGQVAIPMARRFAEVWAVDQEPDMIRVGAEEAARAGVDIRWTASKAEDLGVGPGHLEMITIANAFHRLDRPLIAQQARRWLRPGGSLVIMGSGYLPDDPRPAWRTIVEDSIRDWTREMVPSTGSPPVAVAQPELSHEDLLIAEGFKITHRSFTERHERTLDEVIGHLYSLSYASRRALGPRVDEFEDQLRRRLLDQEPSGQFAEDIGYFFTVAWPANQ